MGKSLVGTQTLENLMKAFAGECQASTRYKYYASVAKKQGYEQISSIFLETSRNEVEHAKRFMKLAIQYTEGENPRMVDINASYPLAYDASDTLANLKSAAEGEHEEWSDLYSNFGDTAKAEGFPEIGFAFHEIAKVEQRHENRYLKLAGNIEKGIVFERDQEIEWKCDNCGYVHKGKSAPEVCPSCVHPQAYFEIFVEAY